MYDEGLFDSQDALEERIDDVFAEINSSVIETKVWEDREEVDGVMELKRVQVKGASSKGWVQTREELEWGVRAAWRNSRKCIMRADYPSLRFVSLWVKLGA